MRDVDEDQETEPDTSNVYPLIRVAHRGGPKNPKRAFMTCAKCQSVWFNAAVVFEVIDGNTTIITSWSDVTCRECNTEHAI